MSTGHLLRTRRAHGSMGPARAPLLIALPALLLLACASQAPGRRPPGLSAPDSRWTAVEGRRVHYLDTGGPGNAIVILHGFAAYSYPFEHIADSLPRNLRVVAPDLPGHGFSDPLEGEYTMNAMVSFVESFVRALDLPPFALMGSSMGANIAAHYSVAHPGQVSRLVLLSPVGLVGQEERAGRIAKRPVLVRIASGFVGRGTVRRLLGWAAGGDWDLVTPELLDAYALSVSTPKRRACQRSVVCNIIGGSYLEEILPKITQPVLLIAGDKDPLLKQRYLEEFQRLLEGERVHVFAGGAHLLHQQFPAEIAALVTEFLRPIRSGELSGSEQSVKQPVSLRR